MTSTSSIFLLFLISYQFSMTTADDLKLSKICEEAANSMRKASDAEFKCLANVKECPVFYLDLIDSLIMLKKCLIEKNASEAETMIPKLENHKCEKETGALKTSQKAYGECVLGMQQCNEVYQEMIKASVALEKCTMYEDQENVEIFD